MDFKMEYRCGNPEKCNKSGVRPAGLHVMFNDVLGYISLNERTGTKTGAGNVKTDTYGNLWGYKSDGNMVTQKDLENVKIVGVELQEPDGSFYRDNVRVRKAELSYGGLVIPVGARPEPMSSGPMPEAVTKWRGTDLTEYSDSFTEAVSKIGSKDKGLEQ